MTLERKFYYDNQLESFKVHIQNNQKHVDYMFETCQLYFMHDTPIFRHFSLG
jgi:hypothetical protein